MPELPSEAEQLATKIRDQIDTILEGENVGAVWIAVSRLFFDLTKFFYGDAVVEKIWAILHEAAINAAAGEDKDPNTRYMNALVDKGYDWSTRIGRAKKAGH